MAAVRIEETLRDLDVQIAAAVQAVAQAQETVSYLRRAREIFSNPRFGDLPLCLESVSLQENEASTETVAAYGALKKLVYMTLSEREGMSPQNLVDYMQMGGYVFRSKTPSISVNEALQTLKNEGKAKQSGKSQSGAYLWVKHPMNLIPDETSDTDFVGESLNGAEAMQ